MDDNGAMRNYISDLLSKRFNIITASHGVDALHKIKQHEIDLVISDVMMPVMDGVQLLKALKDAPKTQNIPVESFVREAVDQLPLGHHKIIVEGDLAIQLHADRHRLDKVLNNLISNAIKYSPNADMIKIEAKGAKGSLRLSVTDFGIGISQDKLTSIFDRFFRVESNSMISGLGLGLYISAEIIKSHQGEIGVISEPGKGSTFWFTIPLY